MLLDFVQTWNVKVVIYVFPSSFILNFTEQSLLKRKIMVLNYWQCGKVIKRQFAENNCCLYNIYNIQVNLNIKKMLFIISVRLEFFFEIYIES